MARLAVVTILMSVILLFLTWVRLVTRHHDRLAEQNSARHFPDQLQNDKRHFIGGSACKNCHSEIADLYAASGHAKTFHKTTDLELAQQLDGIEFNDTKRQQKYLYHYESEGLNVSLPSKFGDERFPLTYALGSGTHGTTFLTLLPHRDGRTIGLEHRVTYYQQLTGLGITVGHPYLGLPSEDVEHFGRILTDDQLSKCIGCHTTYGQVKDQQIVDLIPHVGCESCHGAGSQHASQMAAGLKESEFRNEVHWPDAMAEIRTCGACHRMPESLKKSELVRESKILPRFQPAGLMQSLCFTNSNGAMRCTTCHDPHARVSNDTAMYERTCLDCHKSQSTAACPKGSDNCIQCHMPAVSLEGVATFHDHWIRIRSEDDPAPATPAKVVPGH